MSLLFLFSGSTWHVGVPCTLLESGFRMPGPTLPKRGVSLQLCGGMCHHTLELALSWR